MQGNASNKREYNRKPITTELKLSSKEWKDVLLDNKMFIIEPENQSFKIGDTLILREWTGKLYTGWRLTRKISYISPFGYPGIKRGFVAIGIVEIEDKK